MIDKKLYDWFIYNVNVILFFPNVIFKNKQIIVQLYYKNICIIN